MDLVTLHGNILTMYVIITDNGTSKNKLFGATFKGQHQERIGISTLKMSHCEVTDPTEKTEI